MDSRYAFLQVPMLRFWPPWGDIRRLGLWEMIQFRWSHNDDEIRVLKRRERETRALFLSTMWEGTHGEKVVALCKPVFPWELNLAGTSILAFPGLRTMRNESCLSQLVLLNFMIAVGGEPPWNHFGSLPTRRHDNYKHLKLSFLMLTYSNNYMTVWPHCFGFYQIFRRRNYENWCIRLLCLFSDIWLWSTTQFSSCKDSHSLNRVFSHIQQTRFLLLPQAWDSGKFRVNTNNEMPSICLYHWG